MKKNIYQKNTLTELRVIVLFVVAILTMNISATAQNCPAAASWGPHTGSQVDPFQISNLLGLQDLDVMVSQGNNYFGCYFVLTADIATLTQVIGDSLHPFCGTFDGAGFSITVDLQMPTSDYVGLFACLHNNAQIMNLNINGKITGGNIVGGIAGYADTCSITNCNNYAEYIDGQSSVGGFIGRADFCTITNCSNRAKINGISSIGGVAGDAIRCIVMDCNNQATITGEYGIGGFTGYAVLCTVVGCGNQATITGAHDKVGGIVGGADNCSVRNCDNQAIIKGRDIVGGVAGHAHACSVTNCNNYAEYIDGQNVVGGFIGMANFCTITNCSNETKINGQKFLGGIVGIADISTISSCSNHASISGQEMIGGIAGFSDGPLYVSYISNSINYATIIGNTSVGGVVGRGMRIVNIAYCKNSGDVYGQQHVGGIIGEHFDGIATVERSVNIGYVTGVAQVGGIVGIFNEGTLEYCINAGAVQGQDKVGGLIGNFGNGLSNCSFNYAPIFGINDVGGIAGSANSITDFENCYYDSVICFVNEAVAGQGNLATYADALITEDMIGVNSVLYDTLPCADVFRFDTNLYPRLGNTDIDYLAASPVVLTLPDKSNNITDDFLVYTNYGASWGTSSVNGYVDINGINATPIATGKDTLEVWLNGIVKRVPIEITFVIKAFYTLAGESINPLEIGAIKPNPAVDNASLDINVYKKGNLKITLCDLLGNKISELMNEFVAENTAYNIQMQLGLLSNGTYTLMISLDNDYFAKQIVIAK